MSQGQSHPYPTYLLLSFLLIVVLTAIEMGYDLRHSYVTDKEMSQLLRTHNDKARLVHEMRSHIRERVIALNTMLLVDDPFAVDAAYEDFLTWGNRFIEKRIRLREMIESEEERALLQSLRLNSIEGTAIIERAVALAREGEIERSRQALFREVFPVQEKMLDAADNMLNHYMEQISQQISQSQQHNAKWRILVMTLGIAMIVIIIAVALYVIRRIGHDSQALLQAKEGLEAAVDARTRELSEATEMLMAAQHVAHMGHWDWNILNGDLKWSDEIYRIFGVEPGAFEPSYDAFLQAVHPEDRDRVVECVEMAVRGEKPYGIEHRVIQPDGTERVVYERGMVNHSEDGAPLRMLGTVQDITEHKLTEKKLQQAASVFLNTGDGVMITDNECNIVDVNDAFSEILGYHKEELLGQNPRILRSGRHDESFFQHFWDSLNTCGQWQGEVWDRQKSGQVIPLWLTVNAVQDDNGKLSNYVALFRDISKSKENEQHLWHIAHHDPLTGLPNRSLMYGRLDLAMKQADREESAMALMLLDLDGFKQVNDSLGHGTGDEVLVRVAEILTGWVRDTDTVVRYAGDEFVVVLKGLYQRDAINRIADGMIRDIAQPFEVAGAKVKVGASIGVALYPTNAYDADSLIASADVAMYKAKMEGKGCCRFYDEGK